MSGAFQTTEKARLADLAFERWGVQGHVIPYAIADQVLQADVRESAMSYFTTHDVKWWTSSWDGRTSDMAARPTGHLNSSQVACVNHLEPARQDATVAQQVLNSIDDSLRPAPLSPDGYVHYEWIGNANYLGERGSRTRGANVTSLDAVMCGERGAGRVLVAIEWKYLEQYHGKSTAKSTRGADRVATYRHLLDQPDCPISVPDITWLFYEPYDQLMRQTLLAWQMAKCHEFGATDWIHILVVPEGNQLLRQSAQSAPDLQGSDMTEKWSSVLRDPHRFRVVTPTELLADVDSGGKWKPWRQWLEEVYLT